MLKRTAILTTCLFLIVALVNAQETASDERPTSKVILTELESKTEALARSYREKIEALDGAYIERLTSLREDAAARLLALQKEIASSDLDEAVRLRDLAAEILEQASTPPLQNSARSRLASENESLKEELTRLKEDLNRLRAARPNPNRKPAADVTPFDSVWHGKFTSAFNGKEHPVQAVVAKIIRRTDRAFTISVKLESGRNWEFDVDYSGAAKLSLAGTRRIAARNGVDASKVPPVAGVTGTGVIREDSMVIITQWRLRDGLHTGRYELYRKDQQSENQ